MKRTSSNPRAYNATPSIIIMCIINHGMWSTHHVLSRYLQVQANPPMDGMLVLCTGKLVSIFMTYYWGDYVSSWCKLKTKEEEDQENSTSKITAVNTHTGNPQSTSSLAVSPMKSNSSYEHIGIKQDHELQTDSIGHSPEQRLLESSSLSDTPLFLGRWSKMHVLILNAFLTTARASLNVASAKYSKSYNLSLINSSVIFLVPMADRYFLQAKLPKSLWYAVFWSICGSVLIALSHVPFLNGEDEIAVEMETPTMDILDTYPYELYGCFLQWISCLFIVALRLLIRMTEGMIRPTELVQSANIGTFLLPAIYITLVHPSSWTLQGFYNPSSFLVWFGLTFWIFFFAATAQVSLVQSMGPGLYSSFTAIRIVGAVALSSLLLHESIQNSLEGMGLIVNVVTMTIYLVSLYKDDWSSSNESDRKGTVESGPLADEDPTSSSSSKSELVRLVKRKGPNG